MTIKNIPIGNLQIQSVTLISNQTIDISDYIVYFEIQEDLYSSSMYGRIDLEETGNLVSSPYAALSGPILGNEIIVLSIFNPVTRQDYEINFRINNIEDRYLKNTNVQAYSLVIVRDDMLTDRAMQISKSYRKMEYSEMVSAILKNEMKTANDLDIEQSTGKKSVIIPFWHPFAAINWLASRSKSPKSNGASYMFFETLRNNTPTYVFRTLEDLYKGQVTAEITSSVANVGTPTGLDPRLLNRIQKYQVKNSFNIVDNLYAGMYANTLVRHNIVYKNYYRYKWTYDGGTTHLDDKLLVNQFTNSFKSAHTQNMSLYCKGSSLMHDDDCLTYIPYRKSQLQQLNNIKIPVYITGNFGVNVGDVVKADIATVNPASRIKPKSYDDIFQKYHRGKFLVTNVKHIFAPYGTSTYLELSKDSLDTR